MARTNKSGIDYFPFDVDFFQDEKVQFVSARFGLKGEIVAIRLLCKIYRNGYFIEWNDDTALLFAKSVGDGCQDSFVKDVVFELLKRGFFNKGIFERFSVLTSKGIQKRYFEATKRYQKVDIFKEYLLADVSKIINVHINSINVNINSENVDINSQKEREREREREKENKKEIFDFSFLENDFKEIFLDWIEYKTAKNQKYKSQKSLEACYRQLIELSCGKPDLARQIVDKSLANNWAGLFQLNNVQKQPPSPLRTGTLQTDLSKW